MRVDQMRFGKAHMRLLTICILLSFFSTAIGQTSPTRNWVDSEVKYTDADGKVITVHNSLPKGGGGYTDAAGNNYSYVIFWTRVVNESDSPAELAIKYPAKPLTIFPSPDSYLRIFLPTEKMTLDKVQLGDYGLTNLKSFLDAEFNKASALQRTINPKEEYLFYTAILFYQARGTTRTAFVMKGQDLFFRISVDPDVDSVLIPCGQLVFKNQ
jgi:hypothetical protein